MTVPTPYKFIIKYITPLFLLFVFIGSVFSPMGGDWAGAWNSLLAGNGWILDNGSLIKMVLNTGLREQIAATTDPAQLEHLQTSLILVNASRALLTAVFLGVCLMVYTVARKRSRGKESGS